MKKLIALISVITCIFGLTACGSETQYTEYEQQKIAIAEQLAAQEVVPMMEEMTANNADILKDLTAEEIAYQIANAYGMEADGYAIINGVTSFQSAYEEMGAIVSVGTASSTVDDKQIVVLVEIEGEKKDAQAEVIVSNDMFFRLESVALNPVSSMGELMEKAAMNTLIGMGIVFTVLILISAIISAFGLIPKIQKMFDKKEDKQEEKKESAPAPVVAAPVVEAVDEADDTELVAVIAAAIAAYEGTTSTDGFVVRSIRKVNRSRR